VAEEARNQGNKQVWEVVETWLKAQGGRIKPRQLNTPKIMGALPNKGYVV
jgi:sulfur-oxidizing protein SoxB